MSAIAESLKGRSFTRVADWSRDELESVLDFADDLKQRQQRREEHHLLPGRTLAMIFQKPSTRTRVSFEVGMTQLGGHARYVDGIMIRTFDQADVEELVEHASIPVINGLTDISHPCQALADVMTVRERLGRLEGVRVAYLGDGNNVCASLMVACAKLGAPFVAASPAGYEVWPEAVELAREAGGEVELTTDPHEAATGADVLYTDVWT